LNSADTSIVTPNDQKPRVPLNAAVRGRSAGAGEDADVPPPLPPPPPPPLPPSPPPPPPLLLLDKEALLASTLMPVMDTLPPLRMYSTHRNQTHNVMRCARLWLPAAHNSLPHAAVTHLTRMPLSFMGGSGGSTGGLKT
jgi:hypothetical protein